MVALRIPAEYNMQPERIQEHSAGGVILENGRVLLIRMRNLEGAEVWTFPKGHLEAGETPEAAALREVAEETGFDCEITGELYKAEYSFFRNGLPVDKDVRWYLMKRCGGDGRHDAKRMRRHYGVFPF